MISAVFNSTLNNLHFSICETNLCCSLDFKSYSIFTSWWNQIKQSFQNSRAQWSRREVLKFQSPYAYAKTNTCCFHSTDLAVLCSLYLFFALWIPIFISFPLPDSLDFSSASLFFPSAPIVFCLLHMSHITNTCLLLLVFGLFLTFSTGLFLQTVQCNPPRRDFREP